MQLLRGVEVVLGGVFGGRVHGLHHVFGQHILPHRQGDGAVEEHMVLAYGVAAQPLLPLEGHVLLDLHGAEALEQDAAQGGLDVVVDNLLVAVDRGDGPRGAHHVVQPVVQPPAEGDVAGEHVLLDAPGPQKVVPDQDGLLQGGEAPGLFQAVAPGVHAVVEGDVIQALHVIIRNVGCYRFSGHDVNPFSL